MDPECCQKSLENKKQKKTLHSYQVHLYSFFMFVGKPVIHFLQSVLKSHRLQRMVIYGSSMGKFCSSNVH